MVQLGIKEDFAQNLHSLDTKEGGTDGKEDKRHKETCTSPGRRVREVSRNPTESTRKSRVPDPDNR